VSTGSLRRSRDSYWDACTPMMRAPHSFETGRAVHPLTQSKIPEDVFLKWSHASMYRRFRAAYCPLREWLNNEGRLFTSEEIVINMYEGWNFNSGNYLFTTDTK